jgi:hypothetical protein
MASRKNSLFTTDLAASSLVTLQSNSRLNLVARMLLLVFSVATATLAVIYVVVRADAIVAVLQKPSAGGDAIGVRLLTLGAPVLILAAFAILAGIAAALLHSRSLDESLRTMDSINRLRREDEVAVSARGLVVAFEEQIATIRRSYALMLWLGRTLFIVSLGLFVVAVVSALWRGVDVWTLGMGVTSLGGAMWVAASSVPTNVAHHAANIVQAQLIVTASYRQISLLEGDAFAHLNLKTDNAHQVAAANQLRIEKVVKTAVEQIERFTDPKPVAVEEPAKPAKPARSGNVVVFPKAA